MTSTTSTVPSANQRVVLFAGIAFLVGVLGTATVLSARGNSPAPPAAATPAEAPAEEKGASDTVTLDPDAARSAGIRTAPLAYRMVHETLAVPGTVEVGADRVARVTPPTAGKITRLLVRPGDTVRAGQPLAILNSYDVAAAQAAVHDADAALQQAEAELRTAGTAIIQARSRQAGTEIALRRQRELAKAGAFSQAPLQAARSEQSQAESELLSAQAEQQRADAAQARSEKLFQAGVDSRAEWEQNQATARQAQIRVDQARARVALTRQALEREQKVYGRDLLSQREVQTAEADMRAAQGEVQRAQAEEAAARTAVAGARQRVAGARANLAALAGAEGSARVGDSGQITVVAPVGGTIAELSATPGQAVERTATLMTVENLRAVVVTAAVPEADVARVRVGQRAEVIVAPYPKAVFHGTVQSLSTRLDEKTRALPVRILVDNAESRLRPEMFAQVRLATGASRRALVVPAAALIGEGEESAVYVAGEKEGEFAKRPVTPGKTYGDQVEIARGLKPGDRVVVAGAFVLSSEAQKGELKDED